MKRFSIPFVLIVVAVSMSVEAMEYVVINTDAGHDIDDIVALSLLAKSEEVEILAVVTSGAEAEKRARIARHVLYLLGHDEIPVAAGKGADGDRSPVGGMYHFSEDFGRVPPPGMDGAGLLLHALHSAGRAVTVLSLGPLTTLSEALAADPGAAGRIGSIVCSSGGEGDWEYFRRDPVSVAAVLGVFDAVEVIPPEVGREVTWADVDPMGLEGLPVGRILREMAAYGRPQKEAPLVDTLAAAYCIRRSILEPEVVPCAPDLIGLATGAFPARPVTFLRKFDQRSLRPLLADRLEDPRPTIAACLERVQAHNAELTPALGAPLANDLHSLRRFAREISTQGRLRTSDRESGMKIIHRLLKSLEILQEHEAGRSMIQRLSLASSLLGDIRVLVPAEYRETGRFKGFLGDEASVSVGLDNRGPFDIPRARVQVFDWTLRKQKGESLINLRSGGQQLRSFGFPLAPDGEYADFLRAYVVAAWQYENGWARLPYELWIEVCPPFTMRFAEPPTEDVLSVTVKSNMDRRQQVVVRVEPYCGQWSVPGNERTIDFEPPQAGEVASIFPLLDARAAREQTVAFAIPVLPAGELNALKVAAGNGTYRDSMTVVFPLPGAGVVWLQEVNGATPVIEPFAGRWALATDPASANRHLYYDVLDASLRGGEVGVEIEVDYYDAGTAEDRFAIEYDATFPGEEGERFRASVTAQKQGEEGWHTHRFVLPQAFFGDHPPVGADFRIWDGGDGREVIGRVAISRMQP